MRSRSSDDGYDFWVWALFFGVIFLLCFNKAQSGAGKTTMRAQGGVANVHMKGSSALQSPTDSSYVKKAPITTAADVNHVKAHDQPEFPEALGHEGPRDIQVQSNH